MFRAAQKLSCLTRLKSKLNVLSRSGVVYQISCSQCEAFYVGKTKRRLVFKLKSPSLYASLITLCCYFTCVYPSQCFVYNSLYVQFNFLSLMMS